MEPEKWKWLIAETQVICRSIEVNRKAIGYHNDRDDICSNTVMELLEDPKMADKIYQTRNLKLLKTIILRKLFQESSKEHCATTKDYFTYQRIKDTCTEEHIDMTPSNAYKIAALMKNCDYSIFTIKRILMDCVTRTTMEDDIPVDFWGEMI